jgi:hypothetical protein
MMPREADSIATVLDIDAIRTKGGTQIRVQRNDTVAETYRDEIAAGAVFPPVVVFFDGAEYWLADGFHRLFAHAAANRKEIAAEVRPGSLRDAILYAVGANALHGLHRTNGDKVNAVMTLLKDPEWSQWSNYEIADRCNVSDEMVRQRRASLPIIGSERRYTTKHGTTSTMAVSNIGARPTRPEPDGPPEWRQTDIEEFTAPPAPRFPPEHSAPAENIRRRIEGLHEALTLTPAQAVAASGVKLDAYRRHAAAVAAWLDELLTELETKEKAA